jgi:hypothetical protein
MTDEEDRFVLGIAYQAGRDPNIKKGADGYRDWATEREIELACHGFMKAGGQRSGVFHIDGTDTAGHARIVENYVYRNPNPWILEDGQVVKMGDWLIGAIVDETAWDMVKSGRITGWSPQGKARRVHSDD